MTNTSLKKLAFPQQSFPTDADDPCRAIHNAVILHFKNPFIRTERWDSAIAPSKEQKEAIMEMKPLFMSEDENYFNCTVLIKDCLCEVEYQAYAKRFSLRLITDGVRDIDEIVTKFKSHFPRTEKDGRSVPTKFWRQTQHGGTETTQQLEAPTWEEVCHNYAASTRTELNKLYEKSFKPDNGLILWHGEPGMGKTYALRALMREWQDWCSAEVILDPELFFGQGAAYMMAVLLGNNQDHFYDPDEPNPKKKDWRLLILEDAGELISSDAKQQAGQGFSRMLNLCDGLIGQGFKVMVLITTNEELGAMNNAALRTGRCLSSVRFDFFDRAEANLWREANDLPRSDKGGNMSLSDLYAETRDEKPKQETRKVGFG